MNKKEVFLLLAGFTLYLAIGAAVFVYFENGTVEGTAKEVRDVRFEVTEFWKGAVHTNMSFDEVWHLARGLYQISTESLETNRTIDTLRYWQFYDGFFFALTVITTIGYGHLAPVSVGGQIFSIFYALFGVPMTGILIAGFGNFFSAILLRAHEKSKSKHFNSNRALVVNTIFYLVPGMIIFLFLPAVVFVFFEQWSYLESFYYAFITLTTIGFGDFVAGTGKKVEMENRWVYQIGLTVWIVFGLGYLSMMFNFISKAMKSKPVQRINRTVGKGFRQTQRLISKEMEEFIRSMNDYSDKNQPKRLKKLKRTQSMPLLWKSSSSEVARSYSDTELLKAKHKQNFSNLMQYEANTNTMGFIIHLAKALAFGDLGSDHDDESNCTHSCRSSLLEMLTETIRQVSRRNSIWDEDSSTNLSMCSPLSRQSVNRRSCEVLTPSKFSAVLDIPSEVRHPRRKSDTGSYLDIPSWRRQSHSKLEDVNELGDVNGFPKLNNNKSSIGLPSSRRLSKDSNGKTASQEIEELLHDLQQVEQMWSGQRRPSNTTISNGTTTQTPSLDYVNIPVTPEQPSVEKNKDNFDTWL